MATCKDCISFSRCKEMYEAFGISIDLENSVVCKHFKNKADFLEVKHGRWEINCDGYYPYCGNCKAEPKRGSDDMGRYDHYTDTFIKERGGEK